MLMLIKYEIKKILGNRVAMVTCVLALLVMAGMQFAQYTSANGPVSSGINFQGPDTEKAAKESMDSHAGLLTDERIAADMEIYDKAQAVFSATMLGMDTGVTYSDEILQAVDMVMHDSYYSFIQPAHYVFAEDGQTPTNNLETFAKRSLEDQVNFDYIEAFPITRTQAEKDYWIDMAEQVEWPLTYGYTGPWDNALSSALLLGIGILAVCVALSGVFSGEYQARTAAIVLPTERGRSVLPWAKILASLIFVALYWLVIAGVTLAVHVAVCGIDGWDLPYQLVAGSYSPYPLTLLQTVLLKYVLGFVMSLGVGGITLLLSSKFRYALPVAMVPIALVFAGVLAEYLSADIKVFSLTPFSALSHAYEWLLTYAIGDFVLDIPRAVTLIYIALFAVCVLIATCLFRRHQVKA